MLNLTIHTKNYTVSDKLRKIIERKLEKIGKYFDDKAAFIIVASCVSGTETLEVTITSKGHAFRAQASSRNMYGNVDQVLGKIERQVVRNKEKLRTIIRQEAINEKELSFVKPKQVWDIPATEIKKNKAFEIRQMSDAAAELSLATLDQNFFVYADEQTKDVKVMYTRADGHVGIIDVVNAQIKR
jgi:putative sigma-54 modulation protein